MSEERFANAAPPSPAASIACTSSRSICGGAGTTARAQVFRQLDLHAVARDRAQPGADAAADQRRAPAARGRRSGVPEGLRRGDRRPRRRRAPPAHPWWREHGPMLGNGSIAYFSAEFALHQSLPIYAGGLGVLAGDHCKEASDLGVPLVGVGFMYPQGYFHQRMTNDGWQEERYERINWTDAPIETAHHARRPAVHHRGAARRSHRAGRRVARARSAACGCPARHRPRRERAVGSRAVGAPLRRRSRDAHPAGNHPRHRRRARAARAGHRADGVAPQRRPRRVRRAAAHPRDASSRAGRSTTRSKKCGDRRSSRRTRRCRPDTTRSRSTSSRSTSPARWGELGQHRQTLPRARRIRQRQRLAVQHDRAGAAHRRRSSTASARCTAK